MAFLDFIKNRNAAPQPGAAEKSPAQKPETAKELYNRQAAEEKANRIAPTPDQEARAKQIGNEMRQAMQEPQQRTSMPSNAPADAATRAGQLDKQNHQDKAQEALSPTDGTAGKTAPQEKPKAPERTTPRNSPTVPRRAPSWER